MFCPKCGTQNNDGAAFCKECGAQFRQAGAQASAQAVPQYQAAGGAAGGTAAAVAKRSIGKKPLIIAAVAIVIVAIAVFFFVNSRGCFVISTYNQTSNDGQSFTLISYERANNGMLIEQSVSGKDSSGDFANQTTYKDLVDGISIPENCTGTYQQNSDGYVTFYEYIDPDTTAKTSFSYVYYSPGIIKSRTLQSQTRTITTTYNEDGWPTSISTKYSDSYSGRNNSESYFGYEMTNGGKTVLRYSFDDSSLTTGKKLEQTIELDDHGNISSTRVDSGPSITYTYEKILFPSKMIVATSRLKG